MCVSVCGSESVLHVSVRVQKYVRMCISVCLWSVHECVCVFVCACVAHECEYARVGVLSVLECALVVSQREWVCMCM